MGFLDKLKTYGAGSWKLAKNSKFSAAEISTIESATVIPNSFGGLNVCFLMKNGCKKYGALSTQSNLEEGDSIDVNSLVEIELHRDQDVCFKYDGKAL